MTRISCLPLATLLLLGGLAPAASGQPASRDPGISATMARIDGTLSLRGTSRPLSLQRPLVGAGRNPLDQHGTVGFALTVPPSRAAHRTPPCLPLIGDEVALTIPAAFERRP